MNSLQLMATLPVGFFMYSKKTTKKNKKTWKFKKIIVYLQMKRMI